MVTNEPVENFQPSQLMEQNQLRMDMANPQNSTQQSMDDSVGQANGPSFATRGFMNFGDAFPPSGNASGQDSFMSHREQGRDGGNGDGRRSLGEQSNGEGQGQWNSGSVGQNQGDQQMGNNSADSSTSTLEQQILTELQQIDQELVQIANEIGQLLGGGGLGNGAAAAGDSTPITTAPPATAGDNQSSAASSQSASTSGDSATEAASTNPSTTGGDGQPPPTSTNQAGTVGSATIAEPGGTTAGDLTGTTNDSGGNTATGQTGTTNESGGNTATGQFYTDGTQIIGPDGKPFIPAGINDSTGGGYQYTSQIPTLVQDGANTVRIQATPSEISNPNSGLNQEVQALTAAGMVAVICYNPTGTDSGDILSGSDLQTAESTMATAAAMYKNNPNVWFNTNNESGGMDAQNPAWLQEQEGIIGAIRGAGNNNMIVVDDSNWGQGNTVTGESDPAAASQNSALTENAKALIAAAGGNIIGSVHVYQGGDQSQIAANVTAAVEAIQDQGLPVMIGESGVDTYPAGGTAPSGNSSTGMDASMQVAEQLGIGFLAWTDGGLTDSSGNNVYFKNIMDTPYASSIINEWQTEEQAMANEPEASTSNTQNIASTQDSSGNGGNGNAGMSTTTSSSDTSSATPPGDTSSTSGSNNDGNQAATIAQLTAESPIGPNATVNPDWNSLHAANVANAADAAAAGSNLEFFGDSITANLGSDNMAAFEQPFASDDPQAFGIGGDTAADLLYRINNGEFQGTPKVAVINIGSNDANPIAYDKPGDSVQDVVDDVQKSIESIEARSPDTKILLMGVLPRAGLQPTIDQINAGLATLGNDPNVVFDNIDSQFDDSNGNQNTSLFIDGIHPNDAGYQVWEQAVAPILDQMLGQTSAS